MSAAGSISFRMAANDPCLPGHFPGEPVVPGVRLLDALAVALARAFPPSRLVRLARVKFAAPVLPEQTVLLRWTETAPGRIAFAATVDGVPVLAGQAELGILSGPAGDAP